MVGSVASDRGPFLMRYLAPAPQQFSANTYNAPTVNHQISINASIVSHMRGNPFFPDTWSNVRRREALPAAEQMAILLNQRCNQIAYLAKKGDPSAYFGIAPGKVAYFFDYLYDSTGRLEEVLNGVCG
jgi:hypothetical protein